VPAYVQAISSHERRDKAGGLESREVGDFCKWATWRAGRLVTFVNG
jgi:hypothetical protein